MKISISVALLFLPLLCSCSLQLPELSSQDQFKLDKCHFRVPEPYYSGYADFNLLFSFKVDVARRPVNLMILSNLARIAESEIRDCVSDWRVPEDVNSDFLLASFRWDHNQGWTILRITDAHSVVVLEAELAGRS